MARKKQNGPQEAEWPARSRMARKKQNGPQEAEWPARSRMARKKQNGPQEAECYKLVLLQTEMLVNPRNKKTKKFFR